MVDIFGDVYKSYKILTNVFCVLIMAAFTIFMFHMSFYHSFTVFSWHPSFFTLGSLLLMAEAILALSENNVIALLGFNHQRLVKLHWILQVFAGVSITIGYVGILLYKHRYGTTHLDTWHSITGLISVILFGVGCLGGAIALYSGTFKNLIKPAHVKLAHIIVGILSFVIGIISEGFGIYTRWFLYYTNETVQLICLLLIILATILSVQSALVNAYQRLKRSLS